MVRNTRSSYACARCYKRKKKCDRRFPSCSQCITAGTPCAGLDRGSEAELPRSLASFLQSLVTQLETEQENAIHEGEDATVAALEDTSAVPSLTLSALACEDDAAAYDFAATAARESAVGGVINDTSRYSLPYYRTFFLGAELPFPLAFQKLRTINDPSRHGGTSCAQLHKDVVDKLMTVYIDRIVPQYPLFTKEEVCAMFQRFNGSGDGVEEATANEQFSVSMILAIATLSSRSRDYRRLVSMAEALRGDAFSRLDFGLISTSPTAANIRHLLLLAIYGSMLPSSTNLWQVVGDATRIAIEIGLHQEAPAKSSMSDEVAHFRQRLYWTLYSIERSIAITSHRPYAVAVDQGHVPFPADNSQLLHQDANHDQTQQSNCTQLPYMRLIDRLRFLRLQSEICSVNIGMRPISNPRFTYADWVVDIERRLSDIKSVVTVSRWCTFMELHTILLLHMPCTRNPSPDESFVLRYFDAAVQITNGYWGLMESNKLDNPWHATHHCYEAGNLILYGLWYYRAVIRRYYSTAKVFQVVHQISGCFILLAKQWPAAQQCGALFDRVRKGALSFFSDEISSDSEPSLEAKQLKDLVFRENADVLYACEQSSTLMGQSTFETMFSDIDMECLNMDNGAEFLDFFNFPESPEFMMFGQVSAADTFEQPTVLGSPSAAQSPRSPPPRPRAAMTIDKEQLRTALQNLPVCSHCKTRRIKCDMKLPTCQNCWKARKGCSYWDSALGEEISRKYLHSLQQKVEGLVTAISGRDESIKATAAELARTGAMIRQRPNTGIVMSNILCTASTNNADTPNFAFFGATSIFSRLSSTIGSSIPIPSEMEATVPQPPKPLNNLCSSLTLNMTTRLSQTEAEDLVWYYYRCIEITHPILGQDLIRQTLEDVYSSNSDEDEDCKTPARTRYNLMLAISLALLGVSDQRLQMFSDVFFRQAMSDGIAKDMFIHPSHQSLQLVILLCVYVWLCPDVMDIWRILGHASRMCLDITEIHGSDKTGSTAAGVLFRTLYVIETQVSIAFGRPHQLPNGKDASPYLPDLGSVESGQVPLMVYNIARLQHRFHGNLLRRDWTSSMPEPADNITSWMASCIHDLRNWLDEWNGQIDMLAGTSPPVPQSAASLHIPLKLYGVFQHCEALLLAKVSTDHSGQLLITSEEELEICTRLLQAAESLRQIEGQPTGLRTPNYNFPLTWSRMHSIFTATTVILQHIYKSAVLDSELHSLFRVGLEMLMSLETARNQGAAGLVACLKRMTSSSPVTL